MADLKVRRHGKAQSQSWVACPRLCVDMKKLHASTNESSITELWILASTTPSKHERQLPVAELGAWTRSWSRMSTKCLPCPPNAVDMPPESVPREWMTSPNLQAHRNLADAII